MRPSLNFTFGRPRPPLPKAIDARRYECALVAVLLLSGCTATYEAQTWQALRRASEELDDGRTRPSTTEEPHPAAHHGAPERQVFPGTAAQSELAPALERETAAVDLGQAPGRGREVDSDLQRHVRRGLTRHPQLRAAYRRWRATALRISAARRLPDPTLSYGFFIQSVQTRVGPQRHRLALRQTFPWPTRLTAGADAASARARAMQARFEAQALALRARIEGRYWRLWEIRRIGDVRGEQRELLEGLALALRGRVEAGLSSLVELQQLEVNRARLEDSIEGLLEDERRAIAGLLEATAEPMEGERGFADAASVRTSSAGPPSMQVAESPQALHEAILAHPNLQAMAFLANASESEAESLAAARLPTLTLGLDWVETGEVAAPASPEGNGDDAWVVSLGVHLPLWQGSYGESEQAARADADAHRADTENGERQALLALAQTLSQIRDSHRRSLLIEQTLLPQTMTTFESVLGAYQVGRTGIAALLLAQRDLLELAEQNTRQRARHALAWATLRALVGREVTADDSAEDSAEAHQPLDEDSSATPESIDGDEGTEHD